MGETWDAPLIQQAAALEGRELRYMANAATTAPATGGRGGGGGGGGAGLVLRAPNADLGRDPRWGRTEECFGEDPFFNGSMVVAFVKGLQGDNPKYLQAASLMKHFLANSNEDTRTSSSSNFDERLLREYYSVPFRMGIMEANAQAFMASYNKVNGIPMTCNNALLIDMARKEWGLDGIICTDGTGSTLMVTAHHYFQTQQQAVAATIKASIGQFLDNNRTQAGAAIEAGLLTEADIDNALRGIYRVMIRLGQLDPPQLNPYAQNTDSQAPWLSDSSKNLARLVTQKSIVLLKNSQNLLPLDKSALKHVAVIGTKANYVIFDWYSGQPAYAITPLQGIKDKLGPGVEVTYTPSEDADAAAAAAKAADVAILVVGNHPTCNAPWARTESPNEGKESVDRKGLTLDEEPLVQKVLAANPKSVVVLMSSFPYAINWTQENAPAIVHMTHCSQETGTALADVLFGDYNPAGRLVQTWPKSLDQLPDLMDYNIRNGRTYMYFKHEPLYPFGYGLSYTKFDYSNLRVSARSLPASGKIDVSIDVRNTGQRDGEEVVQLYIKHLNSTVERPNQELKGFTRVAIKAGETKPVTIPLAAERLAYWNVAQHKFVVEPDQIEVQVGASSADIRARQTITVVP
jgi:beta-glucosidase